MAASQILSAGETDGCAIGQSTSDTVSAYYGVTPVSQQSAITAVATTAPVAETSTGAACYGLTSTQLSAMVTAVNSLITALQKFGITA
jgi:hypothetical protein